MLRLRLNQWKVRDYLVLFLPIQIGIVQLLSESPEFVERYYSQGIYPLLGQLNRLLWGWIPLSVGDLMYTLFGLWAIRSLYKTLRHFWSNTWFKIKGILATISVVYGTFYLLWGLNYFRLPLEQQLGISTEYSTEELLDLTGRMVSYINAIQENITLDSTAPVQPNASRTEVYQKIAETYATASQRHPILTYHYPSQKTSLYSVPLSYMGYGGYLNPFSGEAQVNGQIPSFRWPSVAAHEVGHQLGYSAEDDTNFLGYWLCFQSDNYQVQYAAYSSALAYLLGDLRRRDPEAFTYYFDLLNEGVKENYRELRRFWDAHENPTEPIFKALFDSYLKVNQQTAGITSYSRVVALLIGYHRIDPFIPPSSIPVP